VPPPLSPQEAEATGERHITATFRGHEFKLPLDVDEWPLDEVFASVGVRDEKLHPNHGQIAFALRRLLGGQWIDFLSAFPRRRDLVPASQAFAAAAGLAGDERDAAFGALPRLLYILATYPDAVEAGLAEVGIDYRDRWHFDGDGRRRLTLRQICVRLTYLKPTNALSIAMNDGRAPYSATELLLMDVYEAIARVAHPSRPMTADQAKARDEKQKRTEQAVQDYRKRHPEKSRTQTALDIARANAQPRKKAAQHADSQEAQHQN